MTQATQLLNSSDPDNSMVVLPFSVIVREAGGRDRGPILDRGGQELRLFINVQKISKVVELGPLSHLPATFTPFCGIYDMDGLPIPVLDLTSYFNSSGCEGVAAKIEANGTPQGRRLILCNTMDYHVGLIVDRTRKIHRQNNESILPPPGALHRDDGVFCAVARDDRGFSFMLDIETLLEKQGVTLERPRAYETDDKNILKGKRILFVDDSRYFQSLGRQLLEKFSAEVDVASHGREALDKLALNPTTYDLVLTDIEMPVMSGIELARSIRKSSLRAIPIIFHSSISNLAMIEDLRSQGLGDYIVKFDEKHLIEQVLKAVSS